MDLTVRKTIENDFDKVYALFEQLWQGLELMKKADAAYLTTIDKNGFLSTRAMLNHKNGE